MSLYSGIVNPNTLITKTYTNTVINPTDLYSVLATLQWPSDSIIESIKFKINKDKTYNVDVKVHPVGYVSSNTDSPITTMWDIDSGSNSTTFINNDLNYLYKNPLGLDLITLEFLTTGLTDVLSTDSEDLTFTVELKGHKCVNNTISTNDKAQFNLKGLRVIKQNINATLTDYTNNISNLTFIDSSETLYIGFYELPDYIYFDLKDNYNNNIEISSYIFQSDGFTQDDVTIAADGIGYFPDHSGFNHSGLIKLTYSSDYDSYNITTDLLGLNANDTAYTYYSRVKSGLNPPTAFLQNPARKWIAIYSADSIDTPIRFNNIKGIKI